MWRVSSLESTQLIVSGLGGSGGSQNGTGSAAFRLPLCSRILLPAHGCFPHRSYRWGLDTHHADTRNYSSLVVLSSGCELVHGPSTSIGQDAQVTSTQCCWGATTAAFYLRPCSPRQDSHRDSRGAWHAHRGRNYLCSCPFITGSQPKHRELLYGTATAFAGPSLHQARLLSSRGLNMKIVHAAPAAAGAAAAHA